MKLDNLIRDSMLALWLLGALVILGTVAECQTTVYLRDNPAGTQITGCDTATPVKCTLLDDSRFANGDTVAVGGVAVINTGANNISTAHGLLKIGTVDHTAHTVTLTDRSNNPIAANGVWQDGHCCGWFRAIQYIGKVNPYTIVPGLKGYYDGTNGAVTRRMATGAENGLVSVVVSGCPGACVVTVTVSYTMSPVLVPAVDHFSIWGTAGTGTAALNTDGVTADFTVASSTATSYTSTVFSAPGLTNGDYFTSNPHCGPGVTPNGTIQGTDSCVVSSIGAVTTNLFWAVEYSGASARGPTYAMNFYDGGGTYGNQAAQFWERAANVFLVDRVNRSQGTSGSYLLDTILYGLNYIERWNGANFFANEASADAGNYPLVQYHDTYAEGLSVVWGIGQPYLTPTQRQTFLDKILNDISDPTPCTKTVAVPHDTLASGTAQAVTSTSITLALADSAASTYYVHNVVLASWTDVSGGYTSDALITGYNGSTKEADLAAWNGYLPGSGGAPISAVSYSIYSTVKASVNTENTLVTVTGYNTNFGADPGAAGDMMYSINPDAWNGGSDPGGMGGWFTSGSVIGSPSGSPGTTQTITNVLMGGSSSSVWSANPQVYWLIRKWTTGNCGLLWLKKYWAGAGDSQPVQYPIRGGYSTLNGNLPNVTANNGLAVSGANTTLLMALAEFDTRAINDLAVAQTHLFDNAAMAWQWNYLTGYSSSGTNYGFNATIPGAQSTAWNISHNVPSFPDVGTHGPFFEGPALWAMYSPLPDNPYIFQAGNAHNAMFFGGGGSNNLPSPSDSYRMLAAAQWAGSNPGSATAKYTKSMFFSASPGWGYTTPGSLPGDVDTQNATKLDPRGGSSTFTAQPLQQAFLTAATADCAALTWMSPCNSGVSGQALLSKGAGGWTDRGSSLVQVQARGFGGDHDCPEPLVIQVWRVGALLAADFLPVGDCAGGSATVVDSTPEFTGTPTLCTLGLGVAGCGPGTGPYVGTTIASISRWAGANHGTWPVSYGDQNSQYVYAMADATGAYSTTYNHVLRHFAHFKKPGADEIIIQYDDDDTTIAPTQIAIHGHYPQNGQTVATVYGGGTRLIYDEGTTSCPGGCASLNVNRTILEQQATTTDGHGGPTAQSNLITKVIVPTGAPNIFMQWDSPLITISSVTPGTSTTFNATAHGLINTQFVSINQNTGGWAAINSVQRVTVVDADHFTVPTNSSAFTGSFNGTVAAVYIGGNGNTSRVSYCADAASTGHCGATGQNGMELIQIHKIATQPDTALLPTALNPDSNWAGVQVQDVQGVSSSVAVVARHGLIQSTITDFVTTYTGSAQVLIAGLYPGSYPVTVNGTPVTGSPFSVTGGTTGGNLLAFESTAGTVHLNGSSPICMITTGSLPNGTIGTPYSQTIGTANCTPNPPTSNWTVATGSLCPGLSLGSTTGIISGTPSGSPTTCTFTIQVIDTVPTTATSGTLSITQVGASTGPSKTIGGNTKLSGKQ